jgi:hypothetical protein
VTKQLQVDTQSSIKMIIDHWIGNTAGTISVTFATALMHKGMDFAEMGAKTQRAEEFFRFSANQEPVGLDIIIRPESFVKRCPTYREWAPVKVEERLISYQWSVLSHNPYHFHLS